MFQKFRLWAKSMICLLLTNFFTPSRIFKMFYFLHSASRKLWRLSFLIMLGILLGYVSISQIVKNFFNFKNPTSRKFFNRIFIHHWPERVKERYNKMATRPYFPLKNFFLSDLALLSLSLKGVVGREGGEDISRKT